MNISLTPELERWIAKKVESGRYHSASEVVRESLRLLEEREQMKQAQLGQLAKSIREGLDSGPGRPMDVKGIKSRGRRRVNGGGE